jgi:hypothetical protein
MMRRQITRLSSALILGLIVIFAAQAQPEMPPKASAGERGRGEYIDVTVMGALRTGVMAIGAETTGVTISSGGVTWELDLQGHQREVASKLNGHNALVSGRLTKAGGVELKARFIIKVRSIRPAP